MRRYFVCFLIIASLIFKLTVCADKKGSEDTFSVPKNTSYMMVFTAPEGKKEKTQISYFNREGKLINSKYFNHVAGFHALQYNQGDNKWHFFTHDKIYFGNKKVLNNKELQGKYNFASADGKDVVITGGYIKKHKTYFKYVTHGLSYEHKEYAAFDILILYTEKSIQNLRVFCAGKVFVDDRRGRVYIMEMEDGEKVVPTYEIAQYDKKTKKFFIKKNKLSLKKFKEAYNRDGRPIAIGLSVVHGDRVYQYIEIGEEHCKEYIAVSRIDKATGKLTYEKAISLKLKDKDFLFSNVEYMVKDDYIKYYSVMFPNKIIKVNTKTNEVSYKEFIKDPKKDVNNEYYARVIDGNCYALKDNLITEDFTIFKMDEKDNMKKIVKGFMPKIAVGGRGVIADFYVIRK